MASTTAPAAKPATDELVSKRLHIGGLTNPKITHADLRQRFSSFGAVERVDGVGQDANGFPRTFAYLSLTTTPAKLSRCLSLLSGSTWKGSHLRIAEARQVYTVRLEKEREGTKRPLAEEDETAVVAEDAVALKATKKRKLARGVKGVQARNMAVVTPGSIGSKKNWHITPLQHLIRPLLLRPPHPIPKPTLPLPTPTTTTTAAATKAAAKPEKKKKTGKRGSKPHPPPTRARRIVVDPRRYERSHLGENMLDSGVESGSASQPWVCEEVEGEEGVMVRWVREGGDDVEEIIVDRERRLQATLSALEPVSGLQTGVASDGDALADDDDDDDEGDDWVPLLDAAEKPTTSLFMDSPPPPAAVDLPSISPESASSPPSTTTTAAAPIEEDPLEQEILAEKSRGRDILKGLFGGAALSPPPGPSPSGGELAWPSFHDDSDSEDDDLAGLERPVVPFQPTGKKVPNTIATVPGTMVYHSDSEEDAEVQPETFTEAKAVAEVVAEAVAEAEAEAEAEAMEVEDAVAEEAENEDEDGAAEAPEAEEELDPVELAMRELRGWGGDSSEEDDEPAIVSGRDVLRLRGGMGSDSDSEEEDSDDSSSSEDGSSSSSDEDEDEKASAKAPTPPPAAPAPPAKKVNPLKDMFAPSATDATPFSLFSTLDPDSLDLSPAADPTLSTSLPAFIAPAGNASYLGASSLQVQQQQQQQQSASGTASLTPTFKPDASIPFFFPFLHLSEAERAKGPKQQARSVLEIEQEKPNGGVGGFWRRDTDEEMQSRWERDHLELTREYKRRHREAVKRRRRRGGGDQAGEED